MYNNIVLGVVFFVGVWLLLRKLFVREEVQDESKSLDNAGNILAREMEIRRTQERSRSSALERINDERNEKLDLLEKALEKMRAAMPENEQACLTWLREETGIRVRITKEEDHILALGWVVPDMNISQDTETYPENIKGFYRIRYPDAQEEFLPDLHTFIQKAASFIADILA